MELNQLRNERLGLKPQRRFCLSDARDKLTFSPHRGHALPLASRSDRVDANKRQVEQDEKGYQGDEYESQSDRCSRIWPADRAESRILNPESRMSARLSLGGGRRQLKAAFCAAPVSACRRLPGLREILLFPIYFSDFPPSTVSPQTQ